MAKNKTENPENKLSSFDKNLVDTLKKNKSKSVWINEDGEWLFHETKGFVEYSREEVLGLKAE